jgi:Ribose/xylose/arabinose/galactoside ABC-type transport systems, permease components
MRAEGRLQYFIKAHFWTYAIYLLFFAVFFQKIDGHFIYIYIRQAIPWCIALLGEFIILLIFQINFSVGGQLCLQTALLGWMCSSISSSGLSGIVVLLFTSILSGIVFASLNERYKINTFIFSIGFQIIFIGLGDYIRGFITPKPNTHLKTTLSKCIAGLPLWMIVGMGSIILVYIILNYSVMGRLFADVKNSEDSMRHSGLNILLIKGWGFVLGTLLIGVSSLLFYYRIGNTLNFNGNLNTYEIFTAMGIGGIFKLRRNNLVQRSMIGGFGVVFLNALLQHFHIQSMFSLCLGGIIIITSFGAEGMKTKEYRS